MASLTAAKMILNVVRRHSKVTAYNPVPGKLGPR